MSQPDRIAKMQVAKRRLYRTARRHDAVKFIVEGSCARRVRLTDVSMWHAVRPSGHIARSVSERGSDASAFLGKLNEGEYEKELTWDGLRWQGPPSTCN